MISMFRLFLFTISLLALTTCATQDSSVAVDDLSFAIPARSSRALSGSAFAASIVSANEQQREAKILEQFKAGNVPDFLRRFSPIRYKAQTLSGRSVDVVLWTTPDYLAIGSDQDFVRVPMNPLTAQQIADGYRLKLPTVRIVDQVYQAAPLKLAPQPFKPGRDMVTVKEFVRHNQEIQKSLADKVPSELIAGHKKDVVVSNRLINRPKKVAIYGWHRKNAVAIQQMCIRDRKIAKLPAHKREIAIANEILRGNVPSFLRTLTPIDTKLRSGPKAGKTLRYWTLPDYLALGSDDDFVRVPLNVHSIARINAKLDYSLPTVKMVNDIYSQANVKLVPQPIVCGRSVTATTRILEHNRMVDEQMQNFRGRGALIAGHKKDIVQSRRLLKKPKAIAIYGWHRPSAKPIQPLSTIHAADYADYSHGVRLVSNRIEIDGERHDLREILEDKLYASVLSNEGTIPQKAHLKSARGLMSVASHP